MKKSMRFLVCALAVAMSCQQMVLLVDITRAEWASPLSEASEFLIEAKK
jgi:hypothetical protein